MKKIIRAVSLLLALLMLSGTVVLAVEDFTEEQIADYYDPIHYNNSFIPGEISVTLKSSVTQTSGYELLFPELETESIVFPDSVKRAYEKGRINNQYLLVTLKVKTRQSVIDAIELLKVNPNVLVATPNYGSYSAADPEPTPEPEPVEPVIPGDVTGDSDVDNRDLIMIARFIVHLVEFDSVQRASADFNGDSEINNADLIEIAKYVVKAVL
jgi:hypothetical protein